AAVPYGDPGDPRGALGVGGVEGEAVLVGLLERERDGDDAAVELGDRDLRRGVQRGQPVVAVRPGVPAGGEAEALEDRVVLVGDGADIPRFIVAARAGRRGPRPARRE